MKEELDKFRESLPPDGQERSCQVLRLLQKNPEWLRPRVRLELLLVQSPDGDPASGIAELDPSWHFCMPTCFMDSLDIAPTPRKKDGKTTHVVTQGRNFSFKAGALIYDTPKAYTLAWGEALQHIRRCIQIDSAVSAFEDDQGERNGGTVIFTALPMAGRSGHRKSTNSRRTSSSCS